MSKKSSKGNDSSQKVKKGSKKGSLSQGSYQNLTKAETEVLHYLTNEYLTPKKIARRRKTRVTVVYKHIRNLKKKGVINKSYNLVHKTDTSIEPNNHSIRLHGQQFHLKILWQDERYKKLISKIITIDGNTIKLHREAIMIYSNKSFFADEPRKATAKSIMYWNRFFIKLENELNVDLLRPKYQNITLVSSHYAEINNELSKECEVKGDKIRIYSEEDGKLWFEIDNSFNFFEAETRHPQTAERDMQEVVQPFFNELRSGEVPKLSEIMKMMKIIVGANIETASGLSVVVKYMESIIPKKREEEFLPTERPYYIG